MQFLEPSKSLKELIRKHNVAPPPSSSRAFDQNYPTMTSPNRFVSDTTATSNRFESGNTAASNRFTSDETYTQGESTASSTEFRRRVVDTLRPQFNEQRKQVVDSLRPHFDNERRQVIDTLRPKLNLKNNFDNFFVH